jgi:hypothetical protein
VRSLPLDLPAAVVGDAGKLSGVWVNVYTEHDGIRGRQTPGMFSSGTGTLLSTGIGSLRPEHSSSMPPARSRTPDKANRRALPTPRPTSSRRLELWDEFTEGAFPTPFAYTNVLRRMP